jgi:hypothetical protein
VCTNPINKNVVKFIFNFLEKVPVPVPVVTCEPNKKGSSRPSSGCVYVQPLNANPAKKKRTSHSKGSHEKSLKTSQRFFDYQRTAN